MLCTGTENVDIILREVFKKNTPAYIRNNIIIIIL